MQLHLRPRPPGGDPVQRRSRLSHRARPKSVKRLASCEHWAVAIAAGVPIRTADQNGWEFQVTVAERILSSLVMRR